MKTPLSERRLEVRLTSSWRVSGANLPVPPGDGALARVNEVNVGFSHINSQRPMNAKVLRVGEADLKIGLVPMFFIFFRHNAGFLGIIGGDHTRHEFLDGGQDKPVGRPSPNR